MTAGSGLFTKQKPGIPHLNDGELAELRKDIVAEFSVFAPIALEEFTNLVGTAAPGTAVLKAATATVASVVSINAAGLLAAGLAMLAAWPRPLTFTTAGTTAADAPANVVITGTDANGAVASETLVLSQTAATVTSANAYKTITSIVYPAADGTGATIAIGIGAAYLRKTTATVAAAVSLSASQLIQGNLSTCPRYLVFTTAGTTASDAPATATITGLDIQGRSISETVTLAQTATTATSKYAYAKVNSITMPAADGTGATILISPSAAVGLVRKIKTIAGAVWTIKEIMDGTAPTAGTFTAPSTTDLPNGSYTPNTAGNDVHDYGIAYVYDASA